MASKERWCSTRPLEDSKSFNVGSFSTQTYHRDLLCCDALQIPIFWRSICSAFLLNIDSQQTVSQNFTRNTNCFKLKPYCCCIISDCCCAILGERPRASRVLDSAGVGRSDTALSWRKDQGLAKADVTSRSRPTNPIRCADAEASSRM